MPCRSPARCVAGGLAALEITLRTAAAPAAAAAIAKAVPEAIVGLGTVLTREDLETARNLGARFALSPGATPELLDAAAAGELPFIPGIQTSSEIMAALARGFDVVKFFPAVPAGGIAALKALAGPFPQMRFCPTGRNWREQLRRLAGPRQRGLRRRLLAGADVRHPRRRLGSDYRPCEACFDARIALGGAQKTSQLVNEVICQWAALLGKPEPQVWI